MPEEQPFKDISAYHSHLSTLPPSTLIILYIYTPWTEFQTHLTADLSSITSSCPTKGPHPISLIRINGKEDLEIAKLYSIKSAPCLLFLKDDAVLEILPGDIPRPTICSAINRHAGAEIAKLPSTTTDPVVLDDRLISRLTELVKMAPIMVFIKGTSQAPQCRFSRRMVVLLREHGVQFESFDILKDEEVRQGLKIFGEWPTFPQLWVEGKLIGGLEIVKEEFERDVKFPTR